MPQDKSNHTPQDYPASNTASSSSTGRLGERVQSLEEHIGFDQRTIEQLSGEIAQMNQRMQVALRRIESLETRLRELSESTIDRGEFTLPPPPPHSAGPIASPPFRPA